VRDRLVLRIDEALSPSQLSGLATEFRDLMREGGIEQSGALPGEDDALDLPRLHFVFTKRDYSRLRRLIDRINSLPRAAEAREAGDGET
jgi:hypothetical protein